MKDTSGSADAARRALSAAQAIAYGTAIVSVLDGLDAVVFFGLRSGATPVRIFQSIATGLLGRAAYQGGVPAALLGLCLHVVVACGIVTTYVLASRRLTVLRARPWICGPAYGVAAFCVMNLIVIPLSAIGTIPRFTPATLANGLAIHILGVGLPAALLASRTGSTPAGDVGSPRVSASL
jgi:hypothetical protein